MISFYGKHQHLRRLGMALYLQCNPLVSLQIKSTKPDKFTPRIKEKKDDYIRVEYESPILGVS